MPVRASRLAGLKQCEKQRFVEKIYRSIYRGVIYCNTIFLCNIGVDASTLPLNNYIHFRVLACVYNGILRSIHD